MPGDFPSYLTHYGGFPDNEELFEQKTQKNINILNINNSLLVIVSGYMENLRLDFQSY